ncbi:MAG: LysE family translocator [Campylobacterota bacterium]|nr:LysE family translocator [Campylobacterota bacterium]
MSIESMIAFYLAILIFSITPGPGVFALISNSLTNDIKTSYPLAFGMAISDVVYLILAFYGLVALTQSYAIVFELIRIVGGLYLIYLGYKIWTSSIDTNIDDKDKSKVSYFGNFMKGFLISASNPKVIIFYIAFLPTFVDLSALGTNDLIIISLITLLSLMNGLLFISYSASSAKRFLKTKKSVKILNRTAGSIMGLAGGYLIVKN